MILDEPEILDGMRSYAAAQALFAGTPDDLRVRYTTQASWYDTQVDDNEGYFCLVNSGSALEELIGDIVEIRYGNKTIHVYCVGGSNLSTDLALQRAAYFHLESLNQEPISVTAQAVSIAAD